MPRCRICDAEYILPTMILDDELCEECEMSVLEVISEWEMENEEENDSSGPTERVVVRVPEGNAE